MELELSSVIRVKVVAKNVLLLWSLRTQHEATFVM